MSEAFGQRIRSLREEAGMSQRDLAARVGIDFTYLSKIETGVMAAPSDEVIARLADALNFNADTLRNLAAKPPLEWGDTLEGNPRLVLLLRRLAAKRYTDELYQALLDTLTDTQEA